MALIAVLLAAIIGFVIGAGWYMALSKPWIEASGVPVDADGQPTGRNPGLTYGGAFLCILIVAGMLRHVLVSSGVSTPGAGALSGLGVGLFLIAPWITLNVLFVMRPLKLAAIDGGYAALACTAMGLVLTLI